MLFRENLQTLRQLNHLSQEQLAAKVGVSRQSISKWETGEAYPEMPNIIALCTVLRCQITDLISINAVDDTQKFTPATRTALAEFEQKDRQKLRTIAKIISLSAKIAKILTLLAFPVLILVIYLLRYAIANFILSGLPAETPLDFSLLLQPTVLLHLLIILAIVAFYTACAIFTYKLLREVEKLFLRIHASATPFTLENIFSLKRIALYTVLSLILPDLAGLILSLATGAPFEFNIFSVIYVVLIVVLVYIFRYGYALQKDRA